MVGDVPVCPRDHAGSRVVREGVLDAEPHLLLSPLVLARLFCAAVLAVRFAGKVAEGPGAQCRQRERSSAVAERKRDGELIDILPAPKGGDAPRKFAARLRLGMGWFLFHRGLLQQAVV